MSLNPIDIPNTTQDHDNSVDRSSDLSPTSPVDCKRMDRLMADRPHHKDLQSKGILKGEYPLQPSLVALRDLAAASSARRQFTGAAFGAGDWRRLLSSASPPPWHSAVLDAVR